MHDTYLEADEISLDVAVCQLLHVASKCVGQAMIVRKLGKDAEFFVDLKFGTSGKIESGLQPTVLVEAGIGIAFFGT